MWGGLIGVGRVRCQAQGPGRVMDKPESEFYKFSRVPKFKSNSLSLVTIYNNNLFHSNAKHIYRYVKIK